MTTALRIVVCVKQVVDTGAAIQIKDGRVDASGSPRVLNPYDEFAVEEAVRLRERFPGTEVTLVTVGPEPFKDTLRKGLAMGADQAVHLLDPAFEGLDSLGVAHVLARAVRHLGFDLVLCGRQAVDDDMAQIGPALAVLLGIPCVTVITRLEFLDAPGHVRITRQVEGGAEIIEGALPLVLTCQKGLNEPRLPSLKGMMAAKKKEIRVLDAAAIGFNVDTMGVSANRVREIGLSLPPARKKGVLLEGDPEKACAELARILREEIKVI